MDSDKFTATVLLQRSILENDGESVINGGDIKWILSLQDNDFGAEDIGAVSSALGRKQIRRFPVSTDDCFMTYFRFLASFGVVLYTGSDEYCERNKVGCF